MVRQNGFLSKHFWMVWKHVLYSDALLFRLSFLVFLLAWMMIFFATVRHFQILNPRDMKIDMLSGEISCHGISSAIAKTPLHALLLRSSRTCSPQSWHRSLALAAPRASQLAEALGKKRSQISICDPFSAKFGSLSETNSNIRHC